MIDEWKLCMKDIEMIDESRWMKKLEKKIDEQMMKDEWEIMSSTWMNEMNGWMKMWMNEMKTVENLWMKITQMIDQRWMNENFWRETMNKSYQ